MNDLLFHKSLIIGVGLIGASIAKALQQKRIVSEVYGLDTSSNVLEKCKM